MNLTPNTTHLSLRHAFAIAILLHVVILIWLPAPTPSTSLLFSTFKTGLTVHLNLEQEEPFDQTLNTVQNEMEQILQAETGLHLQNPELGFDSNNQSPQQDSQGRDNTPVNESAVGLARDNAESLNLLFSSNAIMQFVREEAVRHADDHPNEVARFNRRFFSHRLTQRNQRSNSYKNQYGDQVVDRGASRGDICFVKQSEPVTSIAGTLESPTYMVHFFRCRDRDPNKS